MSSRNYLSDEWQLSEHSRRLRMWLVNLRNRPLEGMTEERMAVLRQLEREAVGQMIGEEIPIPIKNDRDPEKYHVPESADLRLEILETEKHYGIRSRS